MVQPACCCSTALPDAMRVHLAASLCCSAAGCVQANSTATANKVQRAAEEHCKLLLFTRAEFWQVAPFWKRSIPDMALWQHPAMLTFGQKLDAWFRVQTSFVDTLRQVARAMHHASLGLPIGTAPGVLLGNAIIQHKVSLKSLSRFVCPLQNRTC